MGDFGGFEDDDGFVSLGSGPRRFFFEIDEKEVERQKSISSRMGYDEVSIRDGIHAPFPTPPALTTPPIVEEEMGVKTPVSTARHYGGGTGFDYSSSRKQKISGFKPGSIFYESEDEEEPAQLSNFKPGSIFFKDGKSAPPARNKNSIFDEPIVASPPPTRNKTSIFDEPVVATPPQRNKNSIFDEPIVATPPKRNKNSIFDEPMTVAKPATKMTPEEIAEFVGKKPDRYARTELATRGEEQQVPRQDLPLLGKLLSKTTAQNAREKLSVRIESSPTTPDRSFTSFTVPPPSEVEESTPVTHSITVPISLPVPPTPNTAVNYGAFQRDQLGGVGGAPLTDGVQQVGAVPRRGWIDLDETAVRADKMLTPVWAREFRNPTLDAVALTGTEIDKGRRGGGAENTESGARVKPVLEVDGTVVSDVDAQTGKGGPDKRRASLEEKRTRDAELMPPPQTKRHSLNTIASEQTSPLRLNVPVPSSSNPNAYSRQPPSIRTAASSASSAKTVVQSSCLRRPSLKLVTRRNSDPHRSGLIQAWRRRREGLGVEEGKVTTSPAGITPTAIDHINLSFLPTRRNFLGEGRYSQVFLAQYTISQHPVKNGLKATDGVHEGKPQTIVSSPDTIAPFAALLSGAPSVELSAATPTSISTPVTVVPSKDDKAIAELSAQTPDSTEQKEGQSRPKPTEFKTCAVKRMHDSPDAHAQGMSELAILRVLSPMCPYIVHLIGAKDENEIDSPLNRSHGRGTGSATTSPMHLSPRLLVLLAYEPNGNMWDWVTKHPEAMGRRLWMKWARQLAEAVRVMHLCGVVHHDIKPHNILLSEFLDVKLADFGNACFVPEYEHNWEDDALSTPSSDTSEGLWNVPPLPEPMMSMNKSAVEVNVVDEHAFDSGKTPTQHTAHPNGLHPSSGTLNELHSRPGTPMRGHRQHSAPGSPMSPGAASIRSTSSTRSAATLRDGIGRGTQAYSAPELFQTGGGGAGTGSVGSSGGGMSPYDSEDDGYGSYSYPVDLYSLGVTLFTVMTGKEPFARAKNAVHMMVGITKGFFESGMQAGFGAGGPALEDYRSAAEEAAAAREDTAEHGPQGASGSSGTTPAVKRGQTPTASPMSRLLAPGAVGRSTGHLLQFMNGEAVDRETVSLLKRLLSKDPSARPTAEELAEELAKMDDIYW
ncbi:hypothetical protein BJ742DRAFT_429293 [Cladochytrium replicatum]|nr:hypothetical protein BJ742DRAFT_429293 [Cladochytrium replicatum]